MGLGKTLEVQMVLGGRAERRVRCPHLGRRALAAMLCMPTALARHTRPAASPAPPASCQVIALICTNRPGVQQLDYFTQQAGGSGGGGTAEAEAAVAEGQEASEEEDEPPKKRQRKAKEKVGEAAAAEGGKGKGKGKGKATASKGDADAKLAELAAAAEPPPTLPAADGPRATLIVCPLSVISNWEMQAGRGCCSLGGWGQGWCCRPPGDATCAATGMASPSATAPCAAD